MPRLRVLFLALIAASLVGAAPASASTTAPTTLPTVWACFPGMAADPCEGSEQTTVLASGQEQPRKVARVEDDPLPATPPIDCFYVYPTVTGVLGLNAPRRVDADVLAVIKAQAARFASVCRVFAPVYRQASFVSLGASLVTHQTHPSAAQDLAYSDVLGAWRDYLAHDNDGRGVMLIGHSQGSAMLLRLMAQEMDGNAAERARLVGAILPGANLTVKKGERLGGSFQTIPTCAAPGEAGCAVAFSTFDQQPRLGSYFARISVLSGAFGSVPAPDLEVACTNPAYLSGDGGVLHPVLRGVSAPGLNGLIESAFWNELRPTATTPWVEPGGRRTAACVRQNGANFLRLAVGPTNLRPLPLPTPDWGLHAGEMQLTLGNLVTIVRLQAATWLAAHAG